MEKPDLRRRRLLKGGGVALAGLSLGQVTAAAQAFRREPDGQRHDAWDEEQHDQSATLGQPGDVVLPWLDQPPGAPPAEIAGSQLVWEELDSWLTPPEKFHYVAHYGVPTSGLDAANWRVGVSGLVANPLSLTLADLQARPAREVDFTLECSGNHGFPIITGLIGNARWGGTPLAPVLEEARLLKDAVEVVFYEGKAISVELPTSVEREITWTEPAVKGDTSGKVLKPAKIATGFEVPVPLFVSQGDRIEIVTRTGEYRKRV